MKISEEYVAKLAEGFGKSKVYTKRVIQRFPNPRKHYEILESDKDMKFIADRYVMMHGKYKGVTFTEMFETVKKDCKKYSDIKKNHREFYDFFHRYNHLKKVHDFFIKRDREAHVYKASKLAERYPVWSDFIANNELLYQRCKTRGILNRIKDKWMAHFGYIHHAGVYSFNDFVNKVVEHGSWYNFMMNEKKMYNYLSNKRLIKEYRKKIMKKANETLGY